MNGFHISQWLCYGSVHHFIAIFSSSSHILCIFLIRAFIRQSSDYRRADLGHFEKELGDPLVKHAAELEVEPLDGERRELARHLQLFGPDPRVLAQQFRGTLCHILSYI